MSTGDVNLQRIFFSVAAAATAVARTFPICVGGFIFIIFGRRLRRCNVLSSLLLFD
jgi:hypothetical protein